MLSAFFDVGVQVAVLFILIFIGALLTKLNILTESGVKSITDIVLYAVTPCVIINAFQREYDSKILKNLLVVLLVAFLTMIFSVILAELLYRKKKVDRAVVLKFCVVFSNCGFMSLPLQQAILKDDGVFYGAAYVAVFNIFMWTYGIITMSGKKEIKQISKAIINPGIIGTLIGVLLFVFSVTLPKIAAMPIEFLAALNTPVPMLIIGFYLATTNLKYIIKSKDAYPAVAFRLIIIPLLLIFILKLLGIPKIILVSVTISVCAPAAAITTMMSAKYNHDTKLSAGIVSGSTALSLITMPIMISLAQYI